MYRLIRFLYSVLPKSIVVRLGSSKGLKKLRNSLLRPDNKEIIIKEKIKWGASEFFFFAPVKMAVKAKQRGIENLLLRNSIQLINKLEGKECFMLDIGANYGFISLALQNNTDKILTAHSFEPHPGIYGAFCKSVQENNFTNITVENVAVGNVESNVQLNLYGQTSNIIKLSAEAKDIVTVKQIVMDRYLQNNSIVPDFIKIDVDGYELNVLKGLEKTLVKHRPIMVIETNDDIKVLDYLKSLNYKLYDLDLKEFTGIPNNVFCLPDTTH